MVALRLDYWIVQPSVGDWVSLCRRVGTMGPTRSIGSMPHRTVLPAGPTARWRPQTPRTTATPLRISPSRYDGYFLALAKPVFALFLFHLVHGLFGLGWRGKTVGCDSVWSMGDTPRDQEAQGGLRGLARSGRRQAGGGIVRGWTACHIAPGRWARSRQPSATVLRSFVQPRAPSDRGWLTGSTERKDKKVSGVFFFFPLFFGQDLEAKMRGSPHGQEIMEVYESAGRWVWRYVYRK